MSRLKQVNAFVRVTLTPVTGTPLLWQASTRTLADAPSYWDGKKRGLIEQFGDVERALSDNRGNYVVPTFSFVTDDRDGFWRGLLAAPNTQYLTSSDILFLLVSEEGRTAHVDPRPEFRGQLESPQALPGKKFSVNAQSRLGTRYGPVDLGAPMNKAKFNTTDWPDLPRDFENKTVPALWGEESDLGITNVNDEEISVGRVSPTYCGPVFQGSTSGTPPTAPSFLPDPPALTYDLYGSGGSTTWTYAASVRTENGHTRLGTPVTITGLPNEGDFTGSHPNGIPTNGVALHLAPYSTELMDQVTGADLWVKLGDADSPNQWHKMDAAGQLFNGSSNEFFSGPVGYMDNGDDSHFKSSPPPPDTNTAQVTPGSPGTAPHSIFYDFFCFLRHPGKITKLYGSNLAEEAEYVAISASQVGTDYTSGKNFILGPDGDGVTLVRNGHTYWGFYAKGPIAEAHKNGTMPFRANICGWHEDNDTSLPIIDQAALVYQDVFTQLSGNNGDGFQSGARLTIPNYPTAPTVPILQSTSFDAVQELTKLYIGDDKGYVACVYIDDERTWGDFVTQMNSDFQFDLGENQHGQLILKVMSDMTLPTDGVVLREKAHIKQVSEPGRVQDDEIENDTDYEYDWHPIDGKYISGVKNIQNAESITMYGRRKGPARQLLYIRDVQTAVDSTNRYHLHRIVAPIYVTVTCKMHRATNVELGDQIRLRHRDLIVPEIPLYVKSRRFSYTSREITLMGRMRTADTFASAWAPDVTIGTDYSDATETERATYWFWTNDDGTLPDGSAGSRWR